MITPQIEQDILQRLFKNHQQQNNNKKNQHKLSKYLPKNNNNSILMQNYNFDIPLTTYEQIHRSIQLQRQNLNKKTNIFYQNFNEYQNKILDINNQSNLIYSQLGNKHDIDWIKNIDLPKFDLKQVHYYPRKITEINQNILNQTQTQWTKKANIIQQQTQRLQKQCANIFTLQNQKIQKLESKLFDQLQTLINQKKLTKEVHSTYNTQRLKDRINQARQIFQQKIQNFKDVLNRKFDKKIISMIQKVQKSLIINKK